MSVLQNLLHAVLAISCACCICLDLFMDHLWPYLSKNKLIMSNLPVQKQNCSPKIQKKKKRKIVCRGECWRVSECPKHPIVAPCCMPKTRTRWAWQASLLTPWTKAKTWTVDVPAGTSGRFWWRTDCSFSGEWPLWHRRHCAGAPSSTVSGNPPTTTLHPWWRPAMHMTTTISRWSAATICPCPSPVAPALRLCAHTPSDPALTSIHA